MTTENDPDVMTYLDVFVGEWQMRASFAAEAPPAATTSFEWLNGGKFLVQRWVVDHPDAPDGIAVIGYDTDRSTYLQHYFDSRGVVRVYEMTFTGGVWTLLRFAPEFSQRYVGTLSEDGNTITGQWEMSSDGTDWTPDFDLNYSRITR
jgi:hypothetical protein